MPLQPTPRKRKTLQDLEDRFLAALDDLRTMVLEVKAKVDLLDDIRVKKEEEIRLRKQWEEDNKLTTQAKATAKREKYKFVLMLLYSTVSGLCLTAIITLATAPGSGSLFMFHIWAAVVMVLVVAVLLIIAFIKS